MYDTTPSECLKLRTLGEVIPQQVEVMEPELSQRQQEENGGHWGNREP